MRSESVIGLRIVSDQIGHSGLNARCFKRSNIVRDPAREHIFTDLTGGESKHDRGRCFLRRNKGEPVEIKKHDCRCQRRSLVSVDERVIARDAEAIGSRERGKIGLAIRKLVAGTGQGRLEKAEIANAVWSAKQRELLGMKVKDNAELEPFRLGHFARAL